MSAYVWLKFGQLIETTVAKQKHAKCSVCKKRFAIGDRTIELVYSNAVMRRFCSSECKKSFIDDVCLAKANARNYLTNASERRFLRENRIGFQDRGFDND
jgi:C4-type Zn-finger protein